MVIDMKLVGPKVKFKDDNYAMVHLTHIFYGVMSGKDYKKQTAMHDWCKENCEGYFEFDEHMEYVTFESTKDSVLFSLLWL